MMIPLINLSHLVRFSGAPPIEEKGPSWLTGADRLAQALGWFSLGLGLFEFLAPRRITLKLGLRGREGLVRGFGLREICAGILTLSVDRRAGLLTRVAGDGFDLAVLQRACHRTNRRRRNANAAICVVGAITLLDVFATAAIIAARRRSGARFRPAPASRDR